MLNDGAHAYGYNAESEIKSAAGVNYTGVYPECSRRKHLPGAGGGWSKFAPGVDAKAAIRDALVSPNAQLLPNAENPNSFVVVTYVGRVVGSKGQTAVKIVFDLIRLETYGRHAP